MSASSQIKGHMGEVCVRLPAFHVPRQGLAAAFARAGGSDHVAAFAVLEEADARLVKVYSDLADAGEGAGVVEVAPSPQRDCRSMKNWRRATEKRGRKLGPTVSAPPARHAARPQNEGRLVDPFLLPRIDLGGAVFRRGE